MQNFLNVTIKAINDFTILPNALGRAFGSAMNNQCKTISKKTYGGFTDSDWGKVGNDMKRGLISFGKARS